jgi:hypothetical protein
MDAKPWLASKSIGRIAGFLIASLFAGANVAPSSPTDDNTTNLYRVAFIAFLETRAERYSKIGGVDLRNTRVRQDARLTDSLPRQTGPFRIEFLDSDAVKKQYAKQKKAIPVIVVQPMRNDGDTLIVAFTEYQVSVRKGMFFEGLEGGGDVRLRHDCAAKRFVVARVDLWGI